MRTLVKWGIALLVLLIALAGAYVAWLYWRMPATMEEAEVFAPAPEQPPPVAGKPEIAHPIVAAEAPVVASTTVENSDGIFTQFVISLFGGSQLPDFVYSDRMLRRFVATVDNLPRKELSARIRPVKPAPGMFMADKHGDILSIAPKNEARYEHYVNALESIDVPAMVKFYASHYALFQKAYQELGYAGNFNDRLFEAIDDLLSTPQVQAPVLLVQPKVMYRYADPDIESRSAGQKIMLRMGSDNSTRVKAVLTKVRAELKRYDAKH